MLPFGGCVQGGAVTAAIDALFERFDVRDEGGEGLADGDLGEAGHGDNFTRPSRFRINA